MLTHPQGNRMHHQTPIDWSLFALRVIYSILFAATLLLVGVAIFGAITLIQTHGILGAVGVATVVLLLKIGWHISKGQIR